ncbi:hypothetical protein TNCV_1115051 [Trichonephila clavipes]|nr:hypothetical protein TNCV_1115051 [Trichonephila clavipes]
MPRAHQVRFSRRYLAGVGFFESVRSHGSGPAFLTNGGMQQQQQHNRAIIAFIILGVAEFDSQIDRVNRRQHGDDKSQRVANHV